jgi:hypothetical protein
MAEHKNVYRWQHEINKRMKQNISIIPNSSQLVTFVPQKENGKKILKISTVKVSNKRKYVPFPFTASSSLWCHCNWVRCRVKFDPLPVFSKWITGASDPEVVIFPRRLLYSILRFKYFLDL